MRPRSVALIALAAGAVAGFVCWRRRGGSRPEMGVRLGLADGSVRVFDRADPAVGELERLALRVRTSMTEQH